MNRDRLWMIGAVLVMALVAFMGWTLGVSPLLSQASAADSQTATINEGNTAAQAKLALLRKQYDQLPTLQTELSALRQSIPTGANISEFLNEINDLCDRYNVTLTSVAVNDAQVYVAPIVAAPPAADGSTATATPTPTATADAGAATPAPVVAPSSGLVLVPVVIAVSGKFSNVQSFIGGLQDGPRLYFAGQFTTAPSADAKGVQATITGYAFTLPGISPALESATPTPTPTPTDTSTPTPGATDTSTPTPTGTPTP